MKKTIHIVFDHQDETLSSELQSALTAQGYEITCIPWEQAVPQDYISNVSPKDCQLILFLNMVGFSCISTDGGPTINRIPMNIIVLMTHDIKLYADLLERRINYTVSLLLHSKSDENFVRKNYPHLYQVHYFHELTDLTSYLSDLDWRF